MQNLLTFLPASMGRLAALLALLVLPLVGLGQGRIVISQVYGGGGNAESVYKNDFIELFNRGTAPVDVTGWTVQYAGATGVFTTTLGSSTPLAGIIEPGKYYLIQEAAGTSDNGGTTPLPTADATGSIALAAPSGKVALASNNVVVTGPTDANVVDFVGYGSGVNMYEGSNPTLAPSNANSVQRNSTGCMDTDNNRADFTAAPAAPRNGTASARTCARMLAVTPATLSGFSTGVGTPSAEQSFSVSGTNLIGDVIVTAPTGFQVSKTSGGEFGPSATLENFTGVPTTIYVRMSGVGTPGPQGPADIVVSGSDVASINVSVSGTLTNTYYSLASGTLDNLATYNSRADGTGTAPMSFTGDYQTFFITGAGRTLGGDLTIAGTGSKAVLTSGAEFIIPEAFNFTGPLDLAATSRLTVRRQNPGFVLGTIDVTSTVDFAQDNAAGPVNIPALSYGNLALTSGIKILSAGTTFVRGNLTVDGVSNFNAPVSGLAIVDLSGDFTLLNGAIFNAGAGQNFITVRLVSGGVQTLAGNGNNFSLLRLATVNRNTVAVLAPASGSATSNLVIGNTASSGLNLGENTSLSLGNNTITFERNGILGGTGLITNASTGTIIFNNTGGSNPGNLRLADGATLGTLTLNAMGSARRLDLINSITLNALNLTSGALAIGNSTLTLNGPVVSSSAAGTIQGSATSKLTFAGSSSTTGELVFSSTGNQLQNLTLDQTANTLNRIGSTLTIGTLTLIKGSLFFSGANRAVVINSLSTGNAESFVNALTLQTPVATTATLGFPLGAMLGRYRPLTLAVAQSNASASSYTARIIEENTNSRGYTGAIKRVSPRRYFSLTEETGTNFQSGTLTLSFGSDDDVQSLSALRVATSAGSGSPYADVDPTGMPTTTGTGAAGTITAAITTATLGDFALASTDPTVTPLPVSLVRFAATRQAGGVRLAWATATEKNSDFFEVQRSLDGSTFAAVRRVAAHGNSTQIQEYAALDAQAPAGRLYYRLRQVDLDGTVTFSPAVTVAGANAPAELALYPNPATDRLVATLPAAEGRTYRVLNALGQVLDQGAAATADPVVDVRRLPAGTYFLELRGATGQQVRRFVKSN